MRQRKTTDKQIVEAIQQSKTMTEAARLLGVHLSSFKHHARRIGLYVPNQGRQGCSRHKSYTKIPLEEILEGKHPNYSTTLLKKRLFKDGIKSKQCEECGEKDQGLSFVLDHIDGNHTNHLKTNLRILCPNCHSKTPTFCGRNKKNGKTLLTDKQVLDLILKGHDTRTILDLAHLVAEGANYRRINRLRNIFEYIKQNGKLPA